MEDQRLRNFEGVPKPRRKSPLDRNGDANRGLALVLIIIFLTWLSIVIYVITSTERTIPDANYREAEKKTGKYNPRQVIDELIAIVVQYFLLNISVTTIVFQVVLVTASVLALIACGHFAPDALCKGGIFGIFLLTCYYLLELIRRWFFLRPHPSPINRMDTTVTLLLKLVYVGTAAVCVSKIGVSHITDVVQKCTRTLFRLSYMLIFSLFICALIGTVAGTSLVALKFALLPRSGVLIITLLAFLEAMILSIAIYFYGLAVMSQVVATREWAESDADIPSFLIFKCMRSVFRHRLGIIAYVSTGFGPLLSGAFAWYRTSRERVVSSTPSSKLDSISEIVALLYLVQTTSFHSTIMTSIGAPNFKEATMDVFQLFRKNEKKAYTFFWVFYGIQVLALTVISFLFAIPLAVFILLRAHDDLTDIDVIENLPQWLMLYLVSTVIIFLLTLPVALVLDSIGLTTYFYKLKIEDEASEPQELATLPIVRVPAVPLPEKNMGILPTAPLQEKSSAPYPPASASEVHMGTMPTAPLPEQSSAPYPSASSTIGWSIT